MSNKVKRRLPMSERNVLSNVLKRTHAGINSAIWRVCDHIRCEYRQRNRQQVDQGKTCLCHTVQSCMVQLLAQNRRRRDVLLTTVLYGAESLKTYAVRILEQFQ